MSNSDRDFAMLSNEKRPLRNRKRGRPIIPHPAGSFRERCELAAKMRERGESIEDIAKLVGARSAASAMTMIARGKKYDHYMAVHKERITAKRQIAYAAGLTSRLRDPAGRPYSVWPRYDAMLMELSGKNMKAEQIALEITKASGRYVTRNAVIGRRHRLREESANVGCYADVMARTEDA